ncbi:unnamed protein product [Calicophoron daubneyi]|uniref:E3 ubiquitin-protein ligase n=1 Tax=Calicophoron daubneyi TaxID=300641 RepID=A0AAV2T1V0_CALDB
MNLDASTRATNSASSSLEDRSCHRSSLPASENVARPMAILPIHGIGLLSHLSLPPREVGTTTPLVNTTGTSSNSAPLTFTMPTGSNSGILPQAAPDANAVDLASLFECPVCMDYALPPILQCQSGHIVCASCRSKLSSCPTCRGNLDNIRNLAMEKLAAGVMFPCRYSTSGCPETFHYTAKAEHEAVCEFRPYDCPCPGASCKWMGELDQVMPHLMHHHKSITTLQGEDIVFLATDINLPGAVDWVMMQSCFGHSFMLVLEKQERVPDQIFFALVQLIGTRKQAEQFVYRLELNGHRRRLTWEACPRSMHDGVQSAISSSDCLVFDSNIAQLFADNGNLGINVTISQVPPQN